MRRAAALLVALVAAGCASRQPAPVSDRRAEPPPVVVEAPKPVPAPAPAPAPEPPADKPPPTHVVKPRETLLAIALQYGLDHRELAAWNNITNPNALRVGQVLLVGPPSNFKAPPPVAGAPGATVATPLVTSAAPVEARPATNSPTLKVEPRGQKVPFSERALAQLSAADPNAPPEPTPPVPAPAPSAPATPSPAPAPSPAPPAAEPKTGTDREDVDWMWPVKGKVVAPFTEALKGVDIAGKKGQPVLAAAAGRVVHAGEGLRGYGKLVIIKHNDTWLSAYAHNDKLLVKEQQFVKKGEKIAEMGSTDADAVKLHFEVRRQGKPVDPAKVLPPM